MNSEPSVEIRARPTSSLVLHHEIMIERPVTDVWPRLFEYNQWNPEHIGAKVTRVAGQPNQEGDVRLEFKRNGDAYLPPMVLEIVKVLPFKKVVWRMYEPQEGSPEIYFVDLTLEALGDKTKFVYNSYSEILKEKHKEMPDEAGFREYFTKVFQELKTYAETREGLENRVTST
jgi:hypothetical protein